MRTFGSSIVIAIGIAVALSLLPSIDLSTRDEITVFQRDNPTAVSEETLVDFLSLHKAPFTYRRAEWHEEPAALLIEFTAIGVPTASEIAEQWLQFAQEVFQSTSNVETLICRLYSEHGEALAELETNGRVLQAGNIASGSAADYLARHFHFRVVVE